MNKGLGADNGSRISLLGWRFSPTLICVLYAHLIGMAFNDIKRTEPFARMAEANGAAAEASVLHCPSPWWSTLLEAFSIKMNGKRISLVLLCSTLAYILSTIVILPLSLLFLVSYNVTLPHDVRFHRIRFNATPLSLSTTPEMFLRIMSRSENDLTETP